MTYDIQKSFSCIRKYLERSYSSWLVSKNPDSAIDSVWFLNGPSFVCQDVDDNNIMMLLYTVRKAIQISAL